MRRKRDAAIGDRDRSAEGRGHTALVTGASSGIGYATSTLLAAKGYDIVVDGVLVCDQIPGWVPRQLWKPEFTRSPR